MSTARVTEFELEGADGGPLRGEVFTAGDGSGRPAIVLCHGFRGSKDWGFFPMLSTRLARAGMTAICFNFSGSGFGATGEGFVDTERFSNSTFSNDVTDLATVCESLVAGRLVEGLVRSEGYGLFGYSRGGAAAILHAAANPRVRCLVTWAAISHTDRWSESEIEDWRASGRRYVPGSDNELYYNTNMLDDIEKNARELDLRRASTQLDAPWLIVHGEADGFVPAEEAHELHEASEGKARIEVLPGGVHTFGLSETVTGSETALRSAIGSTMDWFATHLFLV